MSRELGHHEKERAEQLAATGFFSAILCGVLILVFGSIFLRPLTMLLGSTETIAPYAMDYIRVILLGAPYMTASLVLNNLLRFQGNAFLRHAWPHQWWHIKHRSGPHSDLRVPPGHQRRCLGNHHQPAGRLFDLVLSVQSCRHRENPPSQCSGFPAPCTGKL